MKNSCRRFEILLPQRYKDGELVSEELIGETLLELRQEFGAVSAAPQISRLMWRDDQRYFEMVPMFVDVPDVPETRHFFLRYREHLKARFGHVDIPMATYPIDVRVDFLMKTYSIENL